MDIREQADSTSATDFSLVVMLLYSLSTLVPPLPHHLGLTMHFLHALSWRIFHSFGLGLLLRAQSKSKWYVRHYLKHYHYPTDEAEGLQKEGVVKRATEEAFRNWQVGYNISLVMTYGTSPDGFMLHSTNGISVIRGSRLEDLSPAHGLDRERHDASSRAWFRKRFQPLHPAKLADESGPDQPAHLGCRLLIRSSGRLW